MKPLKGQRQIGDFIVSDKVVFYVDDRGPEPTNVHVCSRLDVLAVTHDAEMNNWGKLCSFVDPRGNEKRYHVLSAHLMTSAKTVVSELIKQGLILSGGVRAKSLLVQYLQSTNPAKSMVSSLKPGWVKDSFLLPDGTACGPDKIIYAGDFQDHGHGKAGNWKRNVGRYCSGNSRLILAASAAFAAPLMELADMVEGGGFHYRGESSIGKSTAQEVAGSVYGSPDHIKLTCDATKGSFEKIAEGHNDQLMIIEELGMTDAATVGETIYMLANGMSKARMAGRKRRWRVLSITSGEVTLAEQMAKAGKTPMMGQEVRLLDITAEVVPNKYFAGHRMGAIEELHGFNNSKEIAEHLKAATRKNYGVFAGYMQMVTSRQSEIRIELRRLIDQFTALVTPKKVTGQVSRAIGRFAIVASAGEIATSFGLTGWKKGESIAALHKCFLAWMDYYKSYNPQSVAISRVKKFIAENEARFEVPGKRPIKDKVGYHKKTTRIDAYLILPDVFRTVVCTGANHEDIAKALEDAGYLATSGANRLTRQEWLPGDIQAQRFYAVKSSILAAD